MFYQAFRVTHPTTFKPPGTKQRSVSSVIWHAEKRLWSLHSLWNCVVTRGTKKKWMHLVAHSEPRSSCKPLTTKTENLRLCMTSVDANVSCFVRGYLEKQLIVAWMLINRDATYAKLEDICCYQTKPLLGF